MRGMMIIGVAFLAACGGDETEGPIEVPPGPHHTYVVSQMTVSKNAAETESLGLDIDRKDGDGIDSMLALALQQVDVLFPTLQRQPMVNAAIDHGTPILLLSLRGPELSAGPLELHVMSGGDPTPTACLDDEDLTCRRHLTGTATFSVGAERSTVPLTGIRDGNGYHGGFGEAVMPVILGNEVAWVPMHLARAELTEIFVDRLSGKLGGAVTLDDIQDRLIPIYGNVFRAEFAADCIPGGTPPACACRAGSGGQKVVELFDQPPVQDCQITDAEVTAVSSGLLTPDIDLDGDGLNESLGYAVGISAVAGQFTP